MDEFNEGLGEFESWDDFDKSFQEGFNDIKDELNELGKSIGELKDLLDLNKGADIGENLERLSKLNKELEEFDQELEEFDQELDISDEDLVDEFLDDLKSKFFLVSVDNYLGFADLIEKEIPDYNETYKDSGFSFDELKMFNDKFKKYNVNAIFMQYQLMVEASQNIGGERLFTFVPIDGGKEKTGILIPNRYDLDKGKPKRESEIDEIDAKILDSKLDAFNRGEISFEDFLGSI